MNRKKKNYLHSADFLRGFTALMVMVYHFISHKDANGSIFNEEGSISSAASFLPSVVFIFFSLSGFVIAMSMHKKQYILKNMGSFLSRRWIRIQIPYIASMFVYLSISIVWMYKAGSPIVVEPIRILHHLIYTVPFTEFAWYNEVYWTTGLEFQFYIIIALLFPIIASKKLWVRNLALVLFSASAFLIPDNRLIFRYAPMFVIGIAVYFNWYSDERKHPVIWLLLMLCLIQIGFTFDVEAALYITGFIVVLNLSISETNVIARIGRMSYSLYLIHGAAGGSLLYFLSTYSSAEWFKFVIIIVAILFSLIISYAFYRAVEFPSVQIARRISFGKRNTKHQNG